MTGSSVEVDGLSPDVAFGALASPTRITILRALWAADGPLSFSELHRATDVADSGNLNYHLGKLVGRFVHGTDDGYRLSVAGRAVLQVVAAGTLTESRSLDPAHLDDECPFCDGTVEVSYADDVLSVRCLDCPGTLGEPYAPGTYFVIELPPSVLRHGDVTEILGAGYAYYKARTLSMMVGVCPECAGPVDVSVETCESHDRDGGICDTCETLYASWATYHCGICRYVRRHPVWYRLLTLPSVLAFCAAHGEGEVPPLDRLLLDDVPFSEIEQAVVSENPLEVLVSVRIGDRTLDVVLDENLDPIETE